MRFMVKRAMRPLPSICGCISLKSHCPNTAPIKERAAGRTEGMDGLAGDGIVIDRGIHLQPGQLPQDTFGELAAADPTPGDCARTSPFA
jgi:hypothetical protein